MISLIYCIALGKTHFETMADLKAVFAQFANSANEGEAACLDKKKVKRALKVIILHVIIATRSYIKIHIEYSCTKRDNIFQALGVSKDLNADDILDKMDANKDGTIDLEEWEKFMTPELKSAIQSKLDDSGLVKGFRPLVDIAKVNLCYAANQSAYFLRNGAEIIK